MSIPPPARAAVETLRNRGWEIFTAPASPVKFTGDAGPDALLNDLDGHPHAFVIASVCDRQDSAERVWRIPYELGQRIGSYDFDDLAALARPRWPPRWSARRRCTASPTKMAVVVYRALQRIAGSSTMATPPGCGAARRAAPP